MRLLESLHSIDALHRARAKLLEPSLRFCHPQCFHIGFNLIVQAGNQTLSKLDAIPQGECHGVGRDFIQACVH